MATATMAKFPAIPTELKGRSRAKLMPIGKPIIPAKKDNKLKLQNVVDIDISMSSDLLHFKRSTSIIENTVKRPMTEEVRAIIINALAACIFAYLKVLK
jgi:hypothetical protein